MLAIISSLLLVRTLHQLHGWGKQQFNVFAVFSCVMTITAEDKEQQLIFLIRNEKCINCEKNTNLLVI